MYILHFTPGESITGLAAGHYIATTEPKHHCMSSQAKQTQLELQKIAQNYARWKLMLIMWIMTEVLFAHLKLLSQINQIYLIEYRKHRQCLNIEIVTKMRKNTNQTRK